MHSARILIVTHSPLSLEFGAGQMAINLVEALRSCGHNVTLWSPCPLPPQVKWWKYLQYMRSRLDAFLETQETFDLIDSPALLITKRVSQSVLVIARNVQPDLLYLIHGLNDHLKINCKSLIRTPFSYLYSLFHMFLVLQGWKKANYIFCLGTLELSWMNQWFPWWKNKFVLYTNSISKTEQIFLSKVRAQRDKLLKDEVKFLWIGRWSSHKGTRILLNFITNWVALRPQDTFTIAGCGKVFETDFPPNLLQEKKLRILPKFERDNLHSILENHDIGLFTSKVEGWGLVLNEMLESGMPVFATNAGGVPDLKPFFKELLKPFPPTVEQVFKRTITVNISEDYYERFDWNKVAESYIEIMTKHL